MLDLNLIKEVIDLTTNEYNEYVWQWEKKCIMCDLVYCHVHNSTKKWKIEWFYTSV